MTDDQRYADAPLPSSSVPKRAWNDTTCTKQKGKKVSGASIFGRFAGSELPMKLIAWPISYDSLSSYSYPSATNLSYGYKF